MTSRIKIRKNANKKILALLSNATSIILDEKTSGQDDSFRSKGKVYIQPKDATKFMQEHYEDLCIYLVCNSDGEHEYLSIKDGPYYFCDEVRAYFTASEVNKTPLTIKSIAVIDSTSATTLHLINLNSDALDVSLKTYEKLVETTVSSLTLYKEQLGIEPLPEENTLRLTLSNNAVVTIKHTVALEMTDLITTWEQYFNVRSGLGVNL